MKRWPTLSDSTGFALIEILVALAIGLVVVGAVLASYLSNAQTGRLQSAAAQMDEDAQIGLRILTRELLMAGYAMPTSMNADTRVFNQSYEGRAVFGCDKGFSAAPSANPSTCAVGVRTVGDRRRCWQQHRRAQRAAVQQWQQHHPAGRQRRAFTVLVRSI